MSASESRHCSVMALSACSATMARVLMTPGFAGARIHLRGRFRQHMFAQIDKLFQAAAVTGEERLATLCDAPTFLRVFQQPHDGACQWLGVFHANRRFRESLAHRVHVERVRAYDHRTAVDDGFE